MTEVPRMTPELRADLVAYLDDELGDEATRQVEVALASNPVVRREVEMLTRTWEMLDALPRETASDDFTARTLETIVLAEQQTRLTDSPWYHRGQRLLTLLGYFAGLGIVAVLCFMTTYRWVPVESDKLADDLPIIRDLDRYSALHSPEFLDRIDRRADFYADKDQPNHSDTKSVPPEAEDSE